jgi:hypothetical protein
MTIDAVLSREIKAINRLLEDHRVDAGTNADHTLVAGGAFVAYGLLLGAGCVREAEDPQCPALAPEDLVLTEIAGPQTGNDQPPWIELYNASDVPVDLLGLRLRFRRVDGSSESAALVRRSLRVEAGSYTTLGLDVDTDAERAAFLDYGFAADYQASWLSTAAVQLEACGTRIASVQYTSLPRTGTYALGTTPPTAAASELPASWCTDPQIAAGTAVPGTPQQANAACP